ncbi:MAG: hypothetical protein ACR2K2_08755 [Mycobacteriales bacterium]
MRGFRGAERLSWRAVARRVPGVDLTHVPVVRPAASALAHVVRAELVA